jgi:hypothetical protein
MVTLGPDFWRGNRRCTSSKNQDRAAGDAPMFHSDAHVWVKARVFTLIVEPRLFDEIPSLHRVPSQQNPKTLKSCSHTSKSHQIVKTTNYRSRLRGARLGRHFVNACDLKIHAGQVAVAQLGLGTRQWTAFKSFRCFVVSYHLHSGSGRNSPARNHFVSCLDSCQVCERPMYAFLHILYVCNSPEQGGVFV